MRNLIDITYYIFSYFCFLM